MKWLEKHQIRVMDFPANSPDLNPIENLWWIIKTQIYKKGPFKSKEEIWEQFQQEWNQIDTDVCKSLVESMPKRIQAVIKAKGNPTRW